MTSWPGRAPAGSGPPTSWRPATADLAATLVAGDGGDLLAGRGWWCAATAAGAAATPAELDTVELASSRLPAVVPGTAAAALRAAGADFEDRDLDAEDWWFVTSLEASPSAAAQPHVLELEGVATFAEVFFNGRRVAESSSMFVPLKVVLPGLEQRNDLAVCCRALAPRLSRRAGRGRWRNTLVERQGLRAVRTTLLGRIPGWAGGAAPVGPWRPVRLRPAGRPSIAVRRFVCELDGRQDVGIVEIEATLSGISSEAAAGGAVLAVGTATGPATLEPATLEPEAGAEGFVEAGAGAGAGRGADSWRLRARLGLPGAERWWPHTHGAQPLYPVSVRVGSSELKLGSVGFRSVEVARSGGGFTLVLNGVPIFARGVCVMPPDPVSLAGGEAARAALELARRSHCNLVRIPGTTVYPDADFLSTCDELGLLVWQDCMLANLDPPEDESFTGLLEAELRAVLAGAAHHPCLAVICGGSEVTQQAAMAGLEPAQWRSAVLEELIPGLAGELAPGVPYLESTPSGGALPFRADAGVSHYFGVGAYLRPLEDARRAGVRFAAECLAFSVPPEPETVDGLLGGPSGAGHRPDWKRGVPRDGGVSWDFEDVRESYVERLFGLDARRLRYADPGRALELGRAAVVECFEAVLADWRRPGSGCSGAVVLAGSDLRLGAGWGVVDAVGRPKAPWYALRRLFAPIALLATDEGLNGWRLHACNDTSEAFAGTLELSRWRHGEDLVEQAAGEIEVPPRGGLSLDAASLFKGFRDLTYAYRFAPPGHDVVLAELRAKGGELVADAVLLPLGPGRPVEDDLGLEGATRWTASGWELECRCRRFAERVAIAAEGFLALDSWFHLVPGRVRSVPLLALGEQAGADLSPRVELRALNLAWPVRVS